MNPAKRSGKTLMWVKLPNSGEILKLLVPSYNWKIISGWTNYSGMVTSQKMIEREMDNRGSKSVLISNTVKEQRVDGSWYIKPNPMYLRCTLMGGESRYQIKFPSKHLNISQFSTFLNKENLCNSTQNLNPWFITGFTDAEGSFTISISPDNRSNLKWAVQAIFTINLHKKDIKILEEVKNTLGVGYINFISDSVISYKVKSKKELQVIIDHFDKYPLVTVKLSDFLLFKQCFELIKKGEHLTEEGLLKILGLKTFLNQGLSEKLINAFPNIIWVNRPDYIFKGIPDPFWVSGFISGDGSFYLHINNLKSKLSEKIYFKVVLNFKLCLHIRDEEVIKGLFNYLNLNQDQFSSEISIPRFGEKVKEDIKRSKFIYKTENTISLHVSKFSDIENIIIPFFEKYPISGIKSLDFLDFKKVAEIVKTKGHLTPEGFKTIENINSKMNHRRV